MIVKHFSQVTNLFVFTLFPKVEVNCSSTASALHTFQSRITTWQMQQNQHCVEICVIDGGSGWTWCVLWPC